VVINLYLRFTNYGLRNKESSQKFKIRISYPERPATQVENQAHAKLKNHAVA